MPRTDVMTVSQQGAIITQKLEDFKRTKGNKRKFLGAQQADDGLQLKLGFSKIV